MRVREDLAPTMPEHLNTYDPTIPCPLDGCGVIHGENYAASKYHTIILAVAWRREHGAALGGRHALPTRRR